MSPFIQCSYFKYFWFYTIIHNQLQFYGNKSLKNMVSHHVSLAALCWLKGPGSVSHNKAVRKITDSMNFRLEGRSLPLPQFPILISKDDKEFSYLSGKDVLSRALWSAHKTLSGLITTAVNTCNQGGCTCRLPFSVFSTQGLSISALC